MHKKLNPKFRSAKLVARSMLAVSAMLLLATTIVFKPEQSLVEAIEAEISAEQLAGTIVHLDEVLTMSALMYAVTGDQRWADRYYHFEPQLDVAIKQLMALAPSPSVAHDSAKRTDAANFALVEMETRALELVSNGDKQAAAAILQSAAYDHNKRVYRAGVSRTASDVRSSLGKRISHLHHVRTTGSALLGVALIALMIAVVAALRDDRHTDAESRKLAQIVEQSPAIIMITDTQGNLEYVNSMFTEVTGYSAAEVIGKNPRLLKSGDTPPEQYTQLWDTILAGEQWRGEFANKTRSGKRYCAAATISPIKNSRGKITGFVGIQEDITEAKRAKEEKEKLQADLHRSHKMEAIGFLAGGIAHDFNNILGAILGNAELALHAAPQDGKLKHQLERIIEGGGRAKDLVKQILVFSRGGDSTRQPVVFAEVVEEALSLIRASLPAMVEIRENIDDDAGTVLADAAQLHQIVMNICTNAGHAMKLCGGVLDVSVSRVDGNRDDDGTSPRSTDAGDYVRLAVTDSGCGMDDATLQHIFDPFFTTKGVDEGTGMGLAVVHGIVADHGGRILVHTTPGRGSTFEVYLPVCEDAALINAQDHQRSAVGVESVLIVDDEPTLAETATGLLASLGYRVTATVTCAEALEIFAQRPNSFDIVITDQAMPHMSGLELAKKLRELRADIPIIVASGYSDLVTPETACEHGFHGYVAKPYIARDLGLAIRAALDHPDVDARESDYIESRI